MLARILTTTGLVATGLLLIVVNSTTPTNGGAIGILSVFLLSYVVILTITTYLLWLIVKIISKVGRDVRIFRKPHELSLKRAYYYSTFIAIGPVVLVSLQSVNPIGIYEVSLVCIFIALGCLFVSRRST